MPATYQCDICGRSSLNFRYVACQERGCGTIACYDCAKTAGKEAYRRLYNEDDPGWKQFAKGFLSNFYDCCPNCHGTTITVHNPG